LQSVDCEFASGLRLHERGIEFLRATTVRVFFREEDESNGKRARISILIDLHHAKSATCKKARAKQHARDVRATGRPRDKGISVRAKCA
jgi:hypothetical protein